jgi:hypothetical protein
MIFPYQYRKEGHFTRFKKERKYEKLCVGNINDVIRALPNPNMNY